VSGKFTGSLQLDFGDWGADVGRMAMLLGPLTWQCENVLVVVPAGTISDGATVPRPLWWLLPPWGDRGTQAAVLHDYICELLDKATPALGCDTRSRCDRQFRLALNALGVENWRANAAWLGVRAYSLSRGYWS
jgi:hypothetical protein